MGILQHLQATQSTLQVQNKFPHIAACIDLNKMLVLSSPLALISSVPPVTRTFIALTVLLSAVYANLWWRSLGLEATLYMTLVPGTALYAPWTFLTSAFVETTVFEVRDIMFRCCAHADLVLSVYCIIDICPCCSQIPGTTLGQHRNC